MRDREGEGGKGGTGWAIALGVEPWGWGWVYVDMLIACGADRSSIVDGMVKGVSFDIYRVREAGTL